MKIAQADVWKRRGISLLWGATALAELAHPNEVKSIREFFSLAENWPDDLPSNGGQTLVVAGIEGCLDLLCPTEAEAWVETELRPSILDFQEEYSLEAALVFWLPTGRSRVRMNPATESYTWICSAPYSTETLAVGRILWAGAEADAGRILDPSSVNQNIDGTAWIGLHHPRVS